MLYAPTLGNPGFSAYLTSYLPSNGVQMPEATAYEQPTWPTTWPCRRLLFTRTQNITRETGLWKRLVGALPCSVPTNALPSHPQDDYRQGAPPQPQMLLPHTAL